MPAPKTTLGIDLGTQSVKVLFYDYENRQVVDTASSELQLDQDASGKAEQDAQTWINGLCQALEQISPKIKSSVTAIAVSGQQHGFVALDKNANVLVPVKLWCDTSTQTECDELMRKLGGEANCIKRYGNKIPVGFTASKILALKKNHPEIYQKLDTILLPHDYINYWLSGERTMEYGDASGTGFLNIFTRQWSKDILSAIDSERDLSLCLPQLIAGNNFVGSLNSVAAKLTGLPEGTPVAPGGGDNMMGAIGTGNLSPGRTTISLGTSGTVYAYAEKPIVDNSGNISAFCSSTGGWMPLLCTMNCTVTTEILRSLLNFDLDDFDRAISSAPIGANNVITLPFFNGERTPNLPNAKGCILGLDPSNSHPENLLRSGVESANYALQAYAAAENRDCSTDFLNSHYQFDQELSCAPIASNVAAYAETYRDYLNAVEQISLLYSV